MASYTDAIAQFNPYVQQLPVELMMKVGMQKQAQYDQGVQKIQNYIDNVAGLDAPRPQDKAYLESKLNELGNNLNVVAGGDFSNQQLVSSVGGMASQIIKDPNIQSAIYSAAQIKKNNQKMAEAEKKGELAPENLDLYQKELNKYMNGKVGDQFNGKYIPYADVMAHLRQVAKDTGIDESVIPDLFETDGNGKPIMQRDSVTGQVSPKINKVMAERHIKGKTAEKLLLAFNNSLTPQLKQQLAITGMYENRDLTPVMLAAKTSASFSGHIDRLKTDIARINVALDLAGGSDYDPEKIQLLQAAKADAENALTKIVKQRDEVSNLDYVTQNADAIRANLYATNFLQGTAAQMKEVSDITEYKINPWFDVTMKENQFALQLKTEARQAREFSILRQEHANDKAIENAFRREEFFGRFGYYPGEQNKKKTKPTLGPIDEKDYEGLRSEFEGGYIADVDAQNSLGQKLGLQWLRSRNPNLSDEQLMKQVETWTGGKQNDKTAMMNRFAGRLIDSYIKDPRKIDSEFHGQIEKLKALNDSVASKGDAIRDIEAQAKAIAKAEGIDYEDYEDAIRSIKPIVVGIIQNGKQKQITLPREDVVRILKTRPELGNIFGKFTVDDDQKAEAAINLQALVNKYGEKNLDQIYNILLKQGGAGEARVISFELDQARSILSNSAYKKISKIKGELYAKSELIPRTIIEEVATGTDNKELVAAKVDAVLGKYTTAPNLDPSFDYANHIKVANGDKAKTRFEIKQVNGKIQYKMVTTSKEGSSSAIVEADDYENITGKTAYDAVELDPMFLKLNSSGTTAKGNVPWFSGRSFPLLTNSKYKGTTGNLVRDEDNPNTIWFKLNVPGVGPITFPDAISYPGGLPKTIDGKLNTGLSKASYAISPAVIDALIQKNK